MDITTITLSAKSQYDSFFTLLCFIFFQYYISCLSISVIIINIAVSIFKVKNMLTPSRRVIIRTMLMVISFMTHLLLQVTFIRGFLMIQKHLLQNYKKISKKCFLATKWTVMSSINLNFQSHNSVLPVTKGLKEEFSNLNMCLLHL